MTNYFTLLLHMLKITQRICFQNYHVNFYWVYLLYYLLELVLPLLAFIVITWWVTSLHTLRILWCIWQGQQLLLKFCWYINACQVGTVCSNANFMARGTLITQEYALLRMISLWVYSWESTGVTSSCIDCESAIHIPTCLIEFDGLPGVFCCLGDARSFGDGAGTVCLGSGDILILNITLDLVLTESQRKIQFKGLIILPRLRFLKARLIRIALASWTSISCPARILRVMVIRRAICGSSRGWREKARLCASFVGGLVHFGFCFGWFTDRVCELDD